MSCSGAAELSSRVPRSLGCSCHLKLQQRSSLSSHDHTTMTSHTKAFHDLVFDTVNSLYLQLNLRMSEIHTCQLPTMTHPHWQRTVCGGGLHLLLPKPFWFSLARRRARHLCPLLTHPISCPTFSQSGQCSFLSFVPLDVRWLVFIGGHLVERVAKHTHTHTHQTKQSSHAPMFMAVGSDIAKRFAKTLAPSHPLYRLQGGLYLLTPSASSCSSHS